SFRISIFMVFGSVGLVVVNQTGLPELSGICVITVICVMVRGKPGCGNDATEPICVIARPFCVIARPRCVIALGFSPHRIASDRIGLHPRMTQVTLMTQIPGNSRADATIHMGALRGQPRVVGPEAYRWGTATL